MCGSGAVVGSWSLLIRGPQRARRQAETPLIVLCRFPGPALSADQGNAAAQNNLGLMYDNGRGVIQDYKEAVKWTRLSANQGYAGAQNNLGLMYDNGRGVIQDYKEAVRWYRLSADQGNAGAQRNLGTMYANGRGVIQDYVRAHMWFNISVASPRWVVRVEC